MRPTRSAAPLCWVLLGLCSLCRGGAQLQYTIAATDEVSGAATIATGQRVRDATVTVSRAVRKSQSLPKWCKDPGQSIHGVWHTLSDDEYSDESPYRQCAFPAPAAGPQNPQLIRSRRSNTGFSQGEAADCVSQLRVPKVAMLFLTTGQMPHEPIWERWLASISGVVPTLCVANAVCARGGLQVLSSLSAVCGADSLVGKSVYEQQLLYSVYIHASPDTPPRGPESVFYGRDTLVPRLHTRWGDHSTVEVTRRMLSTALADADNQRFILLSDSCIPLYSPVVVYQQLMHEWRSRISACALPSWDRSIERYNVRMAAGRRENGRIPVEKWRKHMHWFSLIRFHAELVTNDTEIVDTFARDCTMGFDILSAQVDKYRFCMGDEHYVSTLLAVYGLDPQTDCMGHLSHAEFSLESEHPEHPKAYTPQEINATLFKTIRTAKDVVTEAAQNFAARSFRRMEDFDGAADSDWHVPYPDLKQLKPHFHLFARKFPADTVDALLRVLTENDDGGEKLGILGGLDAKAARR